METHKIKKYPLCG